MLLSKHSCLLTILLVASFAITAHAQGQASKNTHDHTLFPCTENGLQTDRIGCQLLARLLVSRFPQGPLFWHLNKFPTREAAEAAKSQAGMVIESDGWFWLFSFGPSGAAPQRGELVATIGPLSLTSDKLPPAKSYEVVAYLAVMPPGTYSKTHTHPGPEAWYILSGEQCLETPAGTKRARAGGSMFVAPATPMSLINSGTSIRRALFIVIHDANQPWSVPTDEWKPTGACYQ